jgi:arginine decarboxylase
VETPLRFWNSPRKTDLRPGQIRPAGQTATAASLGRGGVLIRVSRGVGTGPTRLAAFDAALHDAGVANFNLVRMSSVIPPGSVVREVPGSQQLPGRHGDLLYCVYADAFASTPGDEAWAGVAWSSRGEDNAGLFVEHHGLSEAAVQHDLDATLEDLGHRREGDFRAAGTVLSSVRCLDRPVCALVVASYRTIGWDDGSGQQNGINGTNGTNGFSGSGAP